MTPRPIRLPPWFRLHRDGTVSIRRRGKWLHHKSEISARDFKRLDLAQQRRVERASIRIVEEYHQ
jgi:hypothetical protein